MSITSYSKERITKKTALPINSESLRTHPITGGDFWVVGYERTPALVAEKYVTLYTEKFPIPKKCRSSRLGSGRMNA
jgi:hypothetical protein